MHFTNSLVGCSFGLPAKEFNCHHPISVTPKRGVLPGLIPISVRRPQARFAGGKIEYQLDTGALYTSLFGSLADRLIGFSVSTKKHIPLCGVTGHEFSAELRWLEHKIGGVWVVLKVAFVCSDSLRRECAPEMYSDIDGQALLGMEGLIKSHLFAVSKEQVDVFFRHSSVNFGRKMFDAKYPNYFPSDAV